MNEHWTDTTTLVGFDLETTSKYPQEARPVSMAFTRHDGPHWEPFQGSPMLVNPGMPIPLQAQRIHGITDADAAQGMELEGAVRVMVEKLQAAAEQGWMVVGANVRYDLTVVEWCAGRLGLEGLGVRAPGLMVGDGMLIDRWWDRYRRGPRNLGALCEHYGVELANAHEAQADAVAAVALFRELARGAVVREPEELGHLAAGPWERERWAQLRACEGPWHMHELLRSWHVERAADYQEYRRAHGAPGHVESVEWPWEEYRPGVARGVDYARQWWRENYADLSRVAVNGLVPVDPVVMGTLLAEAFDAGRASVVPEELARAVSAGVVGEGDAGVPADDEG